MDKRIYIPKIKKDDSPLVKTILIEEVIVDNIEKPSIIKEIQVSPMTPLQFCTQFNIIGQDKTDLENKYATKVYSEKQWVNILIKENIVI